MITKTATITHLAQRLTHARVGTDTLFALVRPEAFYERPIPERHRIIFYFGHLEAFDWNLLSQAAEVPSFSPEFDQLFAFGIDPKPGQTQQDERSDWPEIAKVQQYNLRVRQTLDDLSNQISEQILSIALEHRLMHAETFAYLLHALSIDQKHIPSVAPLPQSAFPIQVMLEIPGGTVTLGQPRKDPSGHHQFGWDNEFDGHEVSVSAFAMSKYKVTNGEYLQFVRAGAKPPHFWTWGEGQWRWRTMAGDVPLPTDRPVYVTHEEASAFAAWSGKRLPTEAEFHRAAYGTPNGEEERTYPWGDDAPDTRRGNFNGTRWDPIPVTATPLGDSAFGISQLVGNGWEWTSTVFQPFPGFQPLSCYPGYSAPFFDGNHYVLKGRLRGPTPVCCADHFATGSGPTTRMSMLDFAVWRTNMMHSQTGQADTAREFAVAVGDSLRKVGQRELPSMYLYDELGTALFEAITLLPEYGLTRAEERLLRRHAGDMLEHLPPPVAVVELGSGSGRKTRWILEALADREPVAYFPIDISAAALIKCHQELGTIGAISIVGLETSYLEGLQEAAARRRADQTLLVLFLGSTIGNFDPPAATKFLRDIRLHLKPGDALLLGTDVEKSVHDMLLAYDDPAGVTAAFNLNLLARINRELEGDFALRHFEHHVRYQEMDCRIEMHLRSRRRQTVSIRGADFTCTFRKGETIWTEACHKFRVEEIPGIARHTGFLCEAQWIDTEWAFAENLLIAD